MTTAAWLLSAAMFAHAQDGPRDPVPPKKIAEAIDKGVRWIRQNMDKVLAEPKQEGRGGDRQRLIRFADLAALTLLHAGVKPDDPDLKRLIDLILEKPLESTYTVAIQAMVLGKIDAQKHRLRLAHCAQFLADNQCANGQWSYGTPTDLAHLKALPAAKGSTVSAIKIAKKRDGPQRGDHSNSQYAALGLRACADAGIEFDRALLTKARDAWKEAQSTDGGWSYRSGRGGGDTGTPYGSMTAGGLGALCILDYLLRENYRQDAAASKAVEWLARHFSVTENPSKPKEGPVRQEHLFYYLYGLERAGALYGTDKFGSHDWYAEGSRYLVDKQGTDGSWRAEGQAAAMMQVADTCFAILFLKRATVGIPSVDPRFENKDPKK